MRAIMFILIVAILVLIAGIATGFLNINQIRGGQVPKVDASRNGVSARGGQAPAFQVQTGSVKVGSTQTNVKVPTIQVQKPGQADNATENAQ